MGGENPLEEEMATHSSIPAWETPWTEEPGGLQSMGSQRGGQDLVTEKQQPIMKDLEIVWDTGMKDVHTIPKVSPGTWLSSFNIPSAHSLCFLEHNSFISLNYSNMYSEVLGQLFDLLEPPSVCQMVGRGGESYLS